MGDAYSFDEQLKFGNNWEQEVRERLESLFLRITVDNVDYEERPELQRAGIDHIISKERPSVDVKTQSHSKVGNDYLPFEVLSVVEDCVPGWFVDPSKDTDLIVWVYPNKAETNLHHVGYLMPLKTGIREWWKEHGDEYDYATVPNHGKYGEYTTGVRWVVIDDIPDQYLIEFDPRLSTDKETPQSDITKWAD